MYSSQRLLETPNRGLKMRGEVAIWEQDESTSVYSKCHNLIKGSFPAVITHTKMPRTCHLSMGDGDNEEGSGMRRPICDDVDGADALATPDGVRCAALASLSPCAWCVAP